MSRSYKKHPGFSDNDKSKKWNKRQANKRVRRHQKELDSGCNYKRLYQQWDICDHNFRVFSRNELKEITDRPYKLYIK